MTTRYAPLAILVCFLLGGCSDQESGWTGTISDSAGVTIVSNPDVGSWLPGEEWTVEEELRVGTIGGDADYAFGEVAGVAVDSQGRVLIHPLLRKRA